MHLVAAGGGNSEARAVTRSAYARLATAITLNLDDGLLDVLRRTADKPTPATPALPSRFLQAVARIAAASSAFSARTALQVHQGRIARKEAEIPYYGALPQPFGRIRG
jgi:hypothetical protein